MGRAVSRHGTTTIRDSLLGERLILKKLPSGLECGVIPRPDFAKKFAVIGANYGSVDDRFVSPRTGKTICAPAGVAHFLEHKMFEKKWGNVLEKFSQLGANANAFTSHTVTAYHFTCTGRFWDNLELLLRAVQSVHLTRQNIAKEAGIIQQEIRMYQDSPDWRVVTGLLESLYHRHPVRVDTVGTTESVGRITKSILLECFRAFYTPANMMLVVAGALEEEEVFERCEKLYRRHAAAGRPRRLRVREPAGVFRKEITSYADVKRPRVLIGFKDEKPATGGERLVRAALETDLLLAIVFGKSSPVYLRLYEKGLIDESFSASYLSDRGLGYCAMGGETDSPGELVEGCLKAIRRVRRSGISESSFARIRRRLLGGYLRRFNSLEAAAVRAVAGRFLRYNPFSVLDTLDAITPEDINNRARAHLREEAMSVSTVLPLQSKMQ